jgi:hypothetical protein
MVISSLEQDLSEAILNEFYSVRRVGGPPGLLFEVDRTCKVNGADGNLEREQD